MNIWKIQIKTRKMQIWVILDHIYAKDRFFWEISSPNGLKFTLVFIVFFKMFQISKLKIPNLKIFKFWFSKISNSIFKNHRIMNLKNHRILNRYQNVDPTADKSTSQDAFRIILWKSNFCQAGSIVGRNACPGDASTSARIAFWDGRYRPHYLPPRGPVDDSEASPPDWFV
jgi:hypothetical protein